MALHCQFCRETEGLDTCDWPVERFVPVAYGTLRVGDLVRRYCDASGAKPPAKVVDFAEIDGQCWVTIAMGKRAPLREKRFTVQGRSMVRALRAARCEVVACARHRAERGPGATCCMDHWRSWEGVAA